MCQNHRFLREDSRHVDESLWGNFVMVVDTVIDKKPRLFGTFAKNLFPGGIEEFHLLGLADGLSKWRFD